MDTFAFVSHPSDTEDLNRKFKLARFLPGAVKEVMLRYAPPFRDSEITGITSTYNKAKGWIITCPLTTEQMMGLPYDLVSGKIIRAGKKAEQLGARILGLGGYAKIAGDAGITVARGLGIPVTTGSSYTVAVALESLRLAALAMGHNLDRAEVTIIGATGSFGRVCAEILAREVRHLTLVARNEIKLQKLANKLLYDTGTVVRVSDKVKDSVSSADLVLTATSSADILIEPEDFKPGAVVCDLSRPNNVASTTVRLRDDILVYSGGLVKVPGDIELNFNLGFPPQTANPCIAETMVLALERKYESFSLGRELTVRQVEKINRLAQKHGFRVSGYNCFGKATSEEELTQIKNNAWNKLSRCSNN